MLQDKSLKFIPLIMLARACSHCGQYIGHHSSCPIK